MLQKNNNICYFFSASLILLLYWSKCVTFKSFVCLLYGKNKFSEEKMKAIPKFLIVVLLLVLDYFPTFAQSFNLYSIDTTNFPQMKAMFYARTPMGVDYPNVTPADFDLYENGQLMNASVGVDCKKVNFFPQLAVVLVLDVSTSMNTPAGDGERRFDWVKQGAFAFLDSIKIDPPSVVGFVLFAGDVYKTSPLFDTKQPAYDWLNINMTIAAGSTDFYLPFVKNSPPLGALPLLETAPKDLRRVVIFLSDGEPERAFPDWKRDTVISYAKRIKAQVYSIFITTPVNSQLDWISQNTGGRSFSVMSKSALIDAFRKIVGDIQSRNVCYLTWISPFGCDEASRNRNVKAIFKRIPDSVVTPYLAPTTSIAKIELSDSLLLFGAPGIGTTTRQLTFTARNTDVTINSFTLFPLTTKFSVDWKGKTPPFVLAKNTSHTIDINYIESLPSASSQISFTLDASPCNSPPVLLVAPCGGDATKTIDFGNVPVLSSDNRTDNCVFKNTTAVAIDGEVTLEGTNKDEFKIISGGGKFKLNPAQCLSVIVSFNPQSQGNKTAYLKFAIPSACGDFRTTLTGNGIPSDLPLPPMDFGARRIITDNDSVYVIENGGSSAVTITSLVMENPTDPNFTANLGFSLPMILRPSERLNIPVTFKPQDEGFKSNAIVVSVQGNPNPLKAELVGVGGLPKITAPDVDCGSTPVNTPVTAYLVITNPSQTMDLFVLDVIMASSPNFKFGTGAVTQNFYVPKNNGSVSIPIEFNPTTPGTKTVVALIKCDAASGPLKNPIVNDTVTIFGLGEGLVVVPEQLDFGSISACATRELSVEIDNSLFDATLNLNQAAISGIDATSFVVVSYPNSVPPKSKGVILVRFTPQGGKTNYSANLNIQSNLGTKTVPLVGSIFTETVKANITLADTRFANVGKKLYFPLEIIVQKSHEIDITQINLYVKIYKKSLVVSGFTSSLTGWNWKVEETPDGFLLKGTGQVVTTPLQFSGTISFDTYLSDISRPDVKIQAVFPEASLCILPEESSIKMDLRTCFTEGRLVVTSPIPDFLAEIVPNPTAEDFDVDIQVAFESNVRVEMFNSLGERVRTIFDGVLKTGTYSFYVPTSDISRGLYFVRMRTESYVSTMSVVLTK